MINSIRGLITAKGAASVFLDNRGVEWELAASAMTLSALPAVGQEARIFAWLYHREDSMSLFGFASERERALFLDLISVSGVGPKGALKILSSVRLDQLILYLEEGNVEGLASLPGLGKKTAQKILLQLKDKLSWSDGPGSGAVPAGPEGEWVESLSAMGYERRRVLSVVKKLLKDEEISALPVERKEQEILRRAIVELSS